MLKKTAIVLSLLTLVVGVSLVVTPQSAWASANPCFYSCPSGGSIDCTWSWAGDPTYCCWINFHRCQSYRCSTGQLILSKKCLLDG